MGLIIFFSALALVLFIISMLYVRVEVEYKKTGQDDRAIVDVSILKGYIAYEVNIPAADIKRRFLTSVVELKIKREEPMEKEKKSDIEIPVKFKDLKPWQIPAAVNFAINRAKTYSSVVDYMIHRIRCQDFRWRTEIGLEDPAETGILVGVIWAVKGYLFSRFKSRVAYLANPPTVEVVPSFVSPVFRMNFHCIFDIRIVHIIIAGINFIKDNFHRKG